MSDSAPAVDPQSQSCYLSDKYCIIMLSMSKAFVRTFFYYHYYFKTVPTIRYCGSWELLTEENSSKSRVERRNAQRRFAPDSRQVAGTHPILWVTHFLYFVITGRCRNNWIGEGGREHRNDLNTWGVSQKHMTQHALVRNRPAALMSVIDSHY